MRNKPEIYFIIHGEENNEDKRFVVKITHVRYNFNKAKERARELSKETGKEWLVLKYLKSYKKG